MVAWEGHGTHLPPGFAVLRMETGQLRCQATEWQLRAGPGGSEAVRRSTDPAQLLCRALRLAPASYSGFELMATGADKPLKLFSEVSLICGAAELGHAVVAAYRSIAELAAALQQFASAEHVSVQLSSDEQSIVMRRNGQEDACRRC